MTNGQNPVKPYKGLVPYTEEDARFFFGREGEQEIISANLQAARLTIFYGASGVGKSSVLRAGVVRHLRGLAQKDLEAGGKPKFIALVFSAWQDDPTALLKEVGNAVEQTTGTKLAARVASLSFSEQLRTWNKQVDAELLIVMDQFEDYFLYHPHDDEEGTFAYEFPLAVNRSDLRANFLLSLREEALGKLDRFKGRIIDLFDNYLRLEPLEKDAARSAIVKPIDAYNSLQSAVEHQADIEQELVEEVLRQVVVGKVFVGDIGRGVVSGKGRKDRIGTYIETPYLQLVMTRLWEQEMQVGSRILRCSTLRELGGAKNISRTHLDLVMKKKLSRASVKLLQTCSIISSRQMDRK